VSRVERLSNPPERRFVEGWYELAGPEHVWIQWRLHAFWRQALDLGLPFDAPWRGLDIGCGAGVVARQIEERSRWIVDGADLDETGLELHEPRRGRTLLYDVFDRRAEFEEKFDFVLMFDVLEHHPQPEDFLAAALFHLRPGGWLFVNVPAFQLLWSSYDRANGHFRRYDRGSIWRELSRRPVEIRDMRYWGLSLIPIVLIRKFFLSAPAADAAIVRKGFKAPRGVAHSVLKLLMCVETSLLSRPPAGSSLLAAAIKRGR